MDYWDQLFLDGAVWSYEPADSAIWTANFFKQKKIRNILIPGVGYGRNASPFLDSDIKVTGIEISKNAISTAHKNGFNFHIYHDSVLNMPFDNNIYDGIYCYSLLHLFNRDDRKSIVKSLYDQLSSKAYMVIVVISTKSDMYGEGKRISNDRYLLNNNQSVFFYNEESIEREFGKFGLMDYNLYPEPIKFLTNKSPLLCYKLICRKALH